MTEGASIDLGCVTRVCICGSETWKILATFDEDHEIATYSTEMYCAACGAKAETPLPINKPEERP